VAACFEKETTIHLSQSVKVVIESIITAITLILKFTNIAYYSIQLVWQTAKGYVIVVQSSTLTQMDARCNI
jgi:hypothetical protein